MSVVALTAITACSTPVGVTPLPVTSEQDRTAQSVVKGVLKDPYSAQFGAMSAFQLDNGDQVYCGQVNAKNSYGGYIGYKTFFVRMRGQSVQRVFLDNYQSSLASIGCRAASTGTIGIGQ